MPITFHLLELLRRLQEERKPDGTTHHVGKQIYDWVSTFKMDSSQFKKIQIVQKEKEIIQIETRT